MLTSKIGCTVGHFSPWPIIMIHKQTEKHLFFVKPICYRSWPYIRGDRRILIWKLVIDFIHIWSKLHNLGELNIFFLELKTRFDKQFCIFRPPYLICKLDAENVICQSANMDFWIRHTWNRLKTYVATNHSKMLVDSLYVDFFDFISWLLQIISTRNTFHWDRI